MKKLSHQANELMYLEAILSSYNWDDNLLPLKNVFKRIQHSFWKRFNVRFIYKRRCWMKSVEPWELNMFDPQLTISQQMEIGDSFLLFSLSFSNCLSLWLQITEGLKKLCRKNTVPQKPRKNPKTPRKLIKRKVKVITIFTSELQFKFFNRHVFLFTIVHCQHSTDKYYAWDECSQEGPIYSPDLNDDQVRITP